MLDTFYSIDSLPPTILYFKNESRLTRNQIRAVHAVQSIYVAGGPRCSQRVFNQRQSSYSTTTTMFSEPEPRFSLQVALNNKCWRRPIDRSRYSQEGRRHPLRLHLFHPALLAVLEVLSPPDRKTSDRTESRTAVGTDQSQALTLGWNSSPSFSFLCRFSPSRRSIKAEEHVVKATRICIFIIHFV